MSGPYDNYGGGYGGGGGGGYNPQGSYNQGGGYPPQQGYGGYPPQQGYQYGGNYGQDQNQNFGPPRRQDSFGPPQNGGFQHGQAGQNYGTYDQSNPQGHSGYYGQQQQQQGGGSNDAYAQNQAWMDSNNSQPGQGQQGGQQGYPQTARQSSDPNAPNYDPSAPPMTESDRGLLGALGGGAAGMWAGHKAGHGFLGTIGGAIVGSLTEDFAKKKKHGGNSSWGGNRW